MIEHLMLEKTSYEIDKVKAFYSIQMLNNYTGNYTEKINSLMEDSCISSQYKIPLNADNAFEIAEYDGLPLSDFLVIELPWFAADPIELSRKLDIYSSSENPIEFLIDIYEKLCKNPDDLSLRFTSLVQKYPDISADILQEIEELLIYFPVKIKGSGAIDPSKGKHLDVWLSYKKTYQDFSKKDRKNSLEILQAAERNAFRRKQKTDDYNVLFCEEIDPQITQKAISSLLKLMPFEMLKSYFKTPNDYQLIRDIIVPRFIALALTCQKEKNGEKPLRMLIVGADAFAIEQILNTPELKEIEKLFVISDDDHLVELCTQCATRSKNKKCKFTSRKSWLSSKRKDSFDIGLVLCNTPEFADSFSIFDHIRLYNVRTKMHYYALLTQMQAVKTEDSFFQNPSTNCTICSALILPQDIVGVQAGKRKILIQGQFSVSNDYSSSIELLQLKNIKISNASSQLLTRYNIIKQGNRAHGCRPFYPTPVFINHNDDRLLSSTLRSLFVNATRSNETRQSALDFDFSGDLHISYRKMDEGKTLVACFRSPSNTQGDNNPFGSLLSSTSKRYTIKAIGSEEQWLNRKYPLKKLNRGNDTSVIEEVRKTFEPILKNCDNGITFKTAFWFSFNSLKNQLTPADFDKLWDIVDTSTGYLNLNEEYPIIEDHLSLNNNLNSASLAILSTLAEVAISDGFISKNPLKKSQETHRNKELDEVRKAIQQKNFSRESMNAIVDALTTHIIAQKPEYIGMLIRLLTGMNAGTVCELRWRDIIKCSDYGFRQFQLERQQLADGTVEYYNNQADYRLFPICNILDIELQKVYEIRKPNADDLIVLKDGNKPLSNKELNQLAIPNLRKHSTKILIPKDEDWIEIDLSRYPGDFFRANADFWFGYDCMLTNDEIRYLLGNVPATTVGRHYRDYTNNETQYALFCKLNRWFFQKNASGAWFIKNKILIITVPAGEEAEVTGAAENGIRFEVHRMEVEKNV